MTRPRRIFQIYRDMVELCPRIYTRLLHATNTTSDIYEEAEKHGLVTRRKEKNEDSTRKTVWMVYATPKGKTFAGYVNTMEEMIGLR